MSKKYSVIVSAGAKQELLRHTDFLLRVSADAAKRLYDEFEKVVKSLEENPERCPHIMSNETLYQEYRVLYFGKRYAAIYTIKGTTVYIDHVSDTRQQQPWNIH